MLAFFALLPSAGIGFLCGAIAGAVGKPGWSALIGAALSVGIFGLFVLPFAFCFAAVEAETWLVEFTWLYFVQKAAAGAIGGALGGYVASRSMAPEPGDAVDTTNKPEN